MSHPATSSQPLSTSRIESFTSEAKEAFELGSVGRSILVKSPDVSEMDFRRIGINHIVSRIWFVEGVFDGVAYAAPSGRQYGSAVAEGEMKLVVETLFKHSRSHLLEVTSDPTESDIDQLLRSLEERGFSPSALLAGVHQSLRFWTFKGFVPSQELRRGPASAEGTFRGVPVLHSRLLPDGMILVVDKQELGTLEVKSDFDISVSDIRGPHDRELIRNRLPLLSEADLDEKVRVLCYEIVKPIVLNQDACGFMTTEGTRLEVRVF